MIIRLGVLRRIYLSVRANKIQSPNQSAFTIVELLVVIVVIGLLASVSTVSYAGISQKATVATMQSDLDNASKILKIYEVNHGSYPTSIDSNGCPNAPILTTDSLYCLKYSSNNSLYSYTGSETAFELTIKNGSTYYKISESSAPEITNLETPSSVSGGILSSDATYYYRTFTADGNLVVSDGKLVADLLIIGGGGSGGSNMAGGGGAGGLLYAPSQSLSGTASVVVGLGGIPPADNSWLIGNNGMNSSVGSVVAYGGGGGAGYGTAAGAGGSGGGTGFFDETYPGDGITGQGYPGGEGQSTGGGGAGRVGNDGDGNYWGYGGAGGSGTDAYSSWASATGTGSSGYYAGGGAGNAYYYGPTSNGGGGGMGRVNGIPNTGSGGAGGGYNYTQVGAGGSGIVIIRYTREQVGG
jgi:prepilin-type N-terminal cleavage/methylation domain-containing protein